MTVTGSQFVVPADQPEEFYARLAFPAAQAYYASGAPEAGQALGATCGWHGTDVDPERGSFAVVRADGPLADLVGERLKVTLTRSAAARSGKRIPAPARGPAVYVLCHTADSVPEDISLTRRAFMALAPAWTYELGVAVQVMT